MMDTGNNQDQQLPILHCPTQPVQVHIKPRTVNDCIATDHTATPHTHQAGRWTPLLVLTCAANVIGSCVPAGYGLGVLNAPHELIRAWCQRSALRELGRHLSPGELEVVWACVVSALVLGGAVGSLGAGWLNQRLGRRGTLFLQLLLVLSAAALGLACLQVLAIELLLVSRLLSGVSAGLATASVPMYLSEVAPKRLRGAASALCALGITSGLLLSQILGLGALLGRPDTWPLLLGLGGVPAVLATLATAMFIPESPTYLARSSSSGGMDNAVRQLRRLRGTGCTDADLEPDLAELRAQRHRTDKEEGGSSEDWGVRKIVTRRPLLLGLILLCVMHAGQQLSGINAVFYYIVLVLENAGVKGTGAQVASICAGVVNCAMSVLSVKLVQRLPRRKLMIFSCVASASCLFFLWITITFINATSWMWYICIMALLLYVLFFGLGLGPIPYFVGTELFAEGPRATAMGLGSAANWTGNLLVGMTFPSIQAALGSHSFLPFAVITSILSFYLIRCMPETKGVDPDMVLVYSPAVASRSTSPSPPSSMATAISPLPSRYDFDSEVATPIASPEQGRLLIHDT